MDEVDLKKLWMQMKPYMKSKVKFPIGTGLLEQINEAKKLTYETIDIEKLKPLIYGTAGEAPKWDPDKFFVYSTGRISGVKYYTDQMSTEDKQPTFRTNKELHEWKKRKNTSSSSPEAAGDQESTKN
jgi:hypothetical protein